MPPNQKVSVLFSGGVDNLSEPELVQPIVTQGDIVKLRESINTRLSIRPGGVVRSPKFTQILAPFEHPWSKALNVLASEHGKATLITREIGQADYALADAGRAPYGNGEVQPYSVVVSNAQIVQTIPIAPQRTMGQVAVIVSNDVVWHAYISPYNAGAPAYALSHYRLMVAAWGVDGTQYAQPTWVGDLVPVASAHRWVGLTDHPSGPRAWFVAADGSLSCVLLSLGAGMEAIAGPVKSVVTPGTLAGEFDVTSFGNSDVAFLVHPSAGSSTDATLRSVDVTNGGTINSVAIPGVLNNGGSLAVHCGNLRGSMRVAVAFTKFDGSTIGMYTDLLSPVLAAMPFHDYAGTRIALAFDDLNYDLGPALMIAIESLSTTWISSADAATGASRGLRGARPNLVLCGRPAQWFASDRFQFPIFPMVPALTSSPDASPGESGKPGESNFVDCPSLEILTPYDFYVGPEVVARIVARLGVVRGSVSPVDIRITSCPASRSIVFHDGFLYVAYRVQGETYDEDSRYARLVKLELAPSQLSVAHDRDGSVFLAAACPMQWDGVDYVPMGTPSRPPHVILTAEAHAAPVPDAGVYSVQAITRWTDATGLVHRSRPSAIKSITVNGFSQIKASVEVFPPLQRSGVVQVALYATATNGKTLHLSDTYIPTHNEYELGHPFVMTESPSESDAQIYTSEAAGQEIAPQPPPPAWDICVIGARCWVIDSEFRSRLAYSKYRVAGVGFEFHPALELIFATSAGDLMAVREWGGLTVVLTERAVYQIAGEGPTNQVGGGGSSFATPTKISDLGCSNLASVAVFPGGLIWQFGNRFVTLGLNGISKVSDFECEHDVSANIVLTKTGEVLFFSAVKPEVRVYHYESGRWTTWDDQTLSEHVTAAQVVPWDRDTAIICTEGGGIRRLDALSVSDAESMTMRTDWILLGGDFQDHVLVRDVIFSATVESSHGVEISIWMDYEPNPSTIRTWSADEIASISGTAERYTLRVEPVQQSCRAIRVGVRDIAAGGAGMGPRAGTIRYVVSGDVYEEVFNATSFK